MKLLNLNFDLCELRKGLQDIDFTIKLSQNLTSQSQPKIETLSEEEVLRDDLTIEGPLFVIKDRTSKSLGSIRLKKLSQVQSKAIRLEWAQFSTKLMTVLGLRQSAVAMALSTYKTAVKQNQHSIAANMAYYLSRHYNLYTINTEKSTLYWHRYEEAQKLDQIAKKALFEYGIFLSRFRHGRVVSPQIVNQINATISSLKDLGASQRTCTYAFLLHQLQLYKLNSQNEYVEMISVAEKGLAYFKEYFPNHVEEKLTFLGHIITAHMRLEQYDLAIDLFDRVEALKNNGSAYQLAMLYLMRAALNLNDPERAIEIFENAHLKTSKSNEVQQMHNMQLQYAYLMKGDFDSYYLNADIFNIDCRKTKNNVVVAFLAKDCILSNKVSNQTSQLLTSWKERFGDVPSRTSTFLTLLQLAVKYGFDSEEVKTKQKHVLRLISQLPKEEFESEIVNYVFLWKVLVDKYSK